MITATGSPRSSVLVFPDFRKMTPSSSDCYSSVDEAGPVQPLALPNLPTQRYTRRTIARGLRSYLSLAGGFGLATALVDEAALRCVWSGH